MGKRKIKKVMYWINMGNYPGMLLFSCGFSYTEIIKLLKKKKAGEWKLGLKYDGDNIKWGGYYTFRRDIKKGKHKGKELYYLIIADEFCFTDYEMCKLAHEVLHICQFFLPDILDRNREYEAEAYLHTYLMKQCLEKLR